MNNKFSVNYISAGERIDIYRLWYKVYHKELKRNVPDADHEKMILYDDLEPNSIMICLKNNDQTIGSFRLNTLKSIKKSYYNDILYDFDDSYVLGTKLIIIEHFRKKGLSKLLLEYAFYK